ncbi:N-acetylmuramoyl-L-alanine amidase [Mesorhizobium sp. B1-1-8]|uniref:N-acetylmuramoyl-L-alanine amidase n=1 Tax=Mesorhizobium sp. B1-1-8 TaxID=2589976 RepID=UPI001D017678|nr:N-acetylmuramoyl-L-alanine amidase [Mesorhizobium sp. B1-1-8]UCI05890.1 N-acetylmuramoyl-L-alanine amidase [Mesorhizobium sp. B1-1-8]
MAWALFLLAMLLGLTAVSRADSLLGATGYKMAGDATRMRIVMSFDREPDIKWFLLRSPNRLVVDLPRTRFAISAKDVKPRGLVQAVRYGDQGDGSRLILTGKGPFAIDKLDVLKNDDGSGYRIAIDMSAASEREFDQALANQALTTGSTVSTDKGGRVGTGPISNPGHRFTVVIDPGHGGVDGGAESAAGTVEKNVTLAFAAELRDRLAAVGKYDVFMTRDSDEYLRLDDRVRIARQHEADLLISIHADTINVRGLRGATVYTLSDKASDPEAQALADRENLSDQFAGMVIKDDNKEVTDILIDLIRRETHSFSMSFAHTLVGQLSTSVGLINNPQRSAGFKVLKAPDVPSVLVELGYLSNAKDEAQLLNADWRGKAAQSITNAVALFATAKTAARAGG